jgi:hypothetical protein
MLNKPIKNSKIAFFTMALVFCLSGFSLFAQNTQTNFSQPDKKQLTSVKKNESLSNRESNVSEQNEVTQKKIALMQKKNEEKANVVKEKKLVKEPQNDVKQGKNNQATTLTATKNASQLGQKNSNDANERSLKDMEIKKAKYIQSLKDKNYTQKEIDIAVAKRESKRNNSMNKITK